MHLSSKRLRIYLAASGFALMAFFYASVWMMRLAQDLREPLGQIPQLSARSFPLATEIFDRKGEKIGEFSDERRYFVRLSSLPPHVLQAFISAEDKEFYSHAGISPWSIGRAVLANMKSGGIRQGASTITQQLARMSFLNQEKSLSRKIKEAILALAIERSFSKDQILELYLNTIYLGSRSHGIEAAARNFFRKKSQDLSIAEAALLAALPKSPAAYSPRSHRDRALTRRAWVLLRMEEDGYLPKGQAMILAKIPMNIALAPEDHWSKAPYFVSAVRQDLMRKFEMNGLPRYGLRVFTTLDATLQKAANQNLQEQLHSLEKRISKKLLAKDRLEGAVVMIDPRTGGVLAMQGGRRFRESQFNRSADTSRPIGSLIHPFLVSLALERGFGPLSPVRGESSSMLRGRGMSSTNSPTLVDVLFDGELAGGHALSTLLGYGSVEEFLQRIQLLGGISEHFDPVQEIQSTPLRLGLAFAPLANGGSHVSSRLIRRVEDREGRILFDVDLAREKGSPVMDPKVAFVSYELLRAASMAQHSSRVEEALPRAASTLGRSQDGRDLWLVGLMPSAVSVLWLGSEYGRIPLDPAQDRFVPLLNAFWRDAGSALLAYDPIGAALYSPPAGVAYVRISGTDGKGVSIPTLATKEISQGIQRL